MAKNDNLKDFLTDVADAIREKKGSTDPINPQDFSSEIASIQSGGDIWGFDTIGYSPQNIPMKEWVEYSKLKMEQFTPSNALTIFKNDRGLHFAPLVDLSGITSMVEMFYGCYSLVVVPLYNTTNIINMRRCFYDCLALTDIPLYDTSNVTNMGEMFQSCSSLTDIPLYDTSNVMNMSSMFKYCSSLTTIPQLDTSKVTNMTQMFNACSSLTTIPQLDTSKVTNMAQMFIYCSSLTTIPQFDVSSLTNMYLTLSGCTSLQFALIKNIGKSTLTTYDFSGATVWGENSDEIPDARQSLIDSLITYSYDRASNGMATATIKLSATTKALLTEEEIAQITAKGFTIA